MTKPQNLRVLGLGAGMLAVLYVLGFSNLLLRGSLGVMGPQLAQEMALDPPTLSIVASAFFFAYALMQVPTGMLFDRFGARATLSVMMLFALGGAALFALATSAGMLIGARVLMGIGCAGIFTGAFYVIAQWLPPDRVVTQSGLLNSFAGLGGVCATAPLALLLTLIDWRQCFWIFTAGVAMLLVAIATFLRDAPPSEGSRISRRESLGDVLRGVRRALTQPGMKPLLFIGLPLSASATLSGVWGAPYLKEVHGLDTLARGNVLLAISICSIAGHTIYGSLARLLNSIKIVIIGGGLVVTACLTTLALVSQPPLWLATVLFCLCGVAGTYPMLAFAHARGLVPPELVGRGVSITNTGIMAAIALAQLVFGSILGAFALPDGGLPEYAWRAGFAFQAVASAVALVIYLRVRDCKLR